MAKKKEIVVFASGSGSNFQNLIDHINTGEINANIRCLITDRKCDAVRRAEENNISHYILERSNERYLNTNVQAILCDGIDLIVCVGYLSILNPQFVTLFKGKIINTHPSLLPKFSGRGMYGLNVHQAVLDAGEKESGCTVHYIDTGIDTGPLIDQQFVKVSILDTAHTLQQKILAQEHILLLKVIKYLINKPISSEKK
ncbi:MAG: phosphoribosylglycinamide formyltransferase [Ostreibacterium sp.]